MNDSCPFGRIWLRHLGSLPKDQRDDLSAWCQTNMVLPDQLREVLTELGKDGRRVPLIKAYNLWSRWYGAKDAAGICGVCEGLGFRYVVMVDFGDKTRVVPHRLDYRPCPVGSVYYDSAIPCRHCRPGRRHNEKVGISEGTLRRLDDNHAVSGQQASLIVRDLVERHRAHHGIAAPVGAGEVKEEIHKKEPVS